MKIDNSVSVTIYTLVKCSRIVLEQYVARETHHRIIAVLQSLPSVAKNK